MFNLPSGEYYINTNYLCGPDVIVSPQPKGFPIAIVTAATNLLYATSNSAGYFSSQSLVTYSTTHVYVVQQPICSTATTGAVTNGPGYYRGIGRVRFVKVPDGQMDPRTYILTNAIISQYTNFVYNPSSGKYEARIFKRTVTTPDIVISTQDLSSGPSGNLFVGTVARTDPQLRNRLYFERIVRPGDH